MPRRDDGAADPLSSLSDAERKALAELARDRAEAAVDRRSVLKTGGALGVGALLGAGGVAGSSQPAAACATGSEENDDHYLVDPAWSDVTAAIDGLDEGDRLFVNGDQRLTADAPVTLTKAVTVDFNVPIDIAAIGGPLFRLGDAQNQIFGGTLSVAEIDGGGNAVTAVEFFNVTALTLHFDQIKRCQGYSGLKWDGDNVKQHPDAWDSGSGENVVRGGYIRDCSNGIKSTTTSQWMEGNIIEATIFDCAEAGIHCRGQFTKNEFYGVSDNRDDGAMDLIDETVDYNWYYMKFFQANRIELHGPVWLAYQGRRGAAGYQVHPDEDDRAMNYASEFYETRANSFRASPDGWAKDHLIDESKPAWRTVTNQSADLFEVARAAAQENPIDAWHPKLRVFEDQVRARVNELRADHRIKFGPQSLSPPAPAPHLANFYVSDGSNDVPGDSGDIVLQVTNADGVTKETVWLPFSEM